jgi:hypothetical protein
MDTINNQYGEFTITYASSLAAKGFIKQKYLSAPPAILNCSATAPNQALKGLIKSTKQQIMVIRSQKYKTHENNR